MKPSLKKELMKMNEIDFRVLHLSIEFAKCVRDIKAKFHLTNELMMEELKVDSKTFLEWMNGAYDFTLCDLAMVHAYSAKLETKRFEEKLEESQKITVKMNEKKK